MMDEVVGQQATPGFFILAFTHLRSVVGILFAIPYTGICSIACIIAGFMRLEALCTFVMRIWAGGVLGIFGIRIAVRGESNLPAKGGGIVVFNHQSLFDIPVLMWSTPKHIRFGAKIELFSIPFFGRAMRAVGTLPIARENRSQVLKTYREAEARFAHNTLFVLAPEGTRQKDPVIGRFKKGPFLFALNAGVPVIPVVIRGAFYVLPKKRVSINVGRLVRTVSVEYLPAIPSLGQAPDQIDAFVDLARTAMVATYERLPD